MFRNLLFEVFIFDAFVNQQLANNQIGCSIGASAEMEVKA